MALICDALWHVLFSVAVTERWGFARMW